MLLSAEKTRALELARRGVTLQGIADALGTTQQKFYRAKREDQNFVAALKMAILVGRALTANGAKKALFRGFPETEGEVFRRARIIRSMHSNAAV